MTHTHTLCIVVVDSQRWKFPYSIHTVGVCCIGELLLLLLVHAHIFTPDFRSNCRGLLLKRTRLDIRPPSWFATYPQSRGLFGLGPTAKRRRSPRGLEKKNLYKARTWHHTQNPLSTHTYTQFLLCCGRDQLYGVQGRRCGGWLLQAHYTDTTTTRCWWSWCCCL